VLWLALWVIIAVPLEGGLPAAWAQEDELFVANFTGHSITVYARTASGNTAPLRTLQGAATGLNFPRAVAVDSANNELVVANQGTPTNSITVYARTASGNTAPLRTLQGAATGLDLLRAVAVDSANNELVVVNGGTGGSTGSITVYSRTASGNTAPLRTLSGPATGLNFPEAVAVDSANNELVVLSGDRSIKVYSRTASGNTAPLRTLTGPATGLDFPNLPTGVAVDLANNELLVVTGGAVITNSIRVYSRTASGNTAPLRTISGAATGMIGASGVAVDAANNEVVVVNANPESITVYSRTASGNTAPLRTLQGGATGLSFPTGVAVTTAAVKELFVTNRNPDSITVYARTASGNTAPLRTLSGAATGLRFPEGVAVDLANNELVVANFESDSITVYSRTASGNTAPLRTLSGAATGLRFPVGVAVDLANNELVVANEGTPTDSITVYSRTASGATAPLRTLQGAATGLSGPRGVAVDSVNNELVVANVGNNSVRVYSRTASGNVEPLRVLQGGATGLSDPQGVAVDLANNELVVANAGNNSVTVYARTASGNSPPLRTLSGGATGLSSPVGVAVTTSAFPAAAVSLNGSAFRTGQTITYQATLIPGSTQNLVDIYLGALLPDGKTFLSLRDGSLPVVGPFLVPFLRIQLDSKAVIPFSHTFTGSEPAGTYFAYAGLAVAGTNPFQGANVLSLSVQAFQFMP
jgi:DNA-binding beta-propeller fold protein YncE